MFRIEQNGRMSLGRPKPPTKGGSAPDEEEECGSLALEATDMFHEQTLLALKDELCVLSPLLQAFQYFTNHLQ